MDISRAAAAYQNMGSLGGVSGKKEESLSLDGIGGEAPTGGVPSFSELMAQGMEDARASGYKGEAQSIKALTDKTELHDLVTAVSNMDLTLSTVVAIRDRMINAYQDILKMPI